MTKKRPFAIEKWLVWISIPAVLFVVWNWYSPIAHYYQDDEWFVLPERLWFPDAFSWWKHLVFFSQNRITWVGDYMLYRPGLFTWIWLQDVLVREDRIAQQILLVFVAALPLTLFFRTVKKECGPLLALAAALYAFACIRGHLLYTWPHINGYILSLAFYVLGMNWWLKAKTKKEAWTAGLLFFAATCFHEFISLTLGALVAAEFILWRTKKTRRESDLRLRALAAALLGYASVILFGYLRFRPPLVFSPSELDGLAWNLEHFYRIAMVQLNLVIQILDDLIPFPFVSPALDYLRWAAGVALIGFSAYRTVRIAKTEEGRRAWVWLLPITVLLFGLLLGRVATRGVVKIHYYPIFQFFLVLWIVLLFSPYFRARQKLRIATAVTFIASSLWAARLIGQLNRQEAVDSRPTLQAVSGIREFLNANPERCFAGVFDALGRTRINAAANIALFHKTCAQSGGRSAYFALDAQGSVREAQAPAPLRPAHPEPLVAQLLAPIADNSIAPYLKALTYNYKEAALGLRHSGSMEVRYLLDPKSANEISARFEATEPAPELLNVGLLLRAGGETWAFLLLNNVLRVVYADASGAHQELANTQLSAIKREFSLRVTRAGEGGLVFVDDHLLTQISYFPSGPALIGVLALENGTEPERVTQLQYGL